MLLWLLSILVQHNPWYLNSVPCCWSPMKWCTPVRFSVFRFHLHDSLWQWVMFSWHSSAWEVLFVLWLTSRWARFEFDGLLSCCVAFLSSSHLSSFCFRAVFLLCYKNKKEIQSVCTSSVLSLLNGSNASCRLFTMYYLCWMAVMPAVVCLLCLMCASFVPVYF